MCKDHQLPLASSPTNLLTSLHNQGFKGQRNKFHLPNQHQLAQRSTDAHHNTFHMYCSVTSSDYEKLITSSNSWQHLTYEKYGSDYLSFVGYKSHIAEWTKIWSVVGAKLALSKRATLIWLTFFFIRMKFYPSYHSPCEWFRVYIYFLLKELTTTKTTNAQQNERIAQAGVKLVRGDVVRFICRLM